MIYRVTNGVPRELYSRVAVTPLASSQPARPCDLSFKRGTPGPPLSRWRDSVAPPASDRSVRVVAFLSSTKATREKREGMVEGSTCSLPGHIFKHGIGRIGPGNGSLNLREAIRGCSYVSTSLLQFKSHPRIILCSRLLYRVEPCIKSFVERGH